MTALLSLAGVTAGYVPDAPILRAVTIEVAEGELVTVVGPNGAGKSTLMKVVVGLLRPRNGDVRFAGGSTVGLLPHEIARRGIGYVPQRRNVFPNLTVEENLELAAGTQRAVRRHRLQEAYELFPALEERRRQHAGSLSGGERQMLAIARALAPEPRLLLLDEPSAGLAPAVMGVIFRTLRRMNDSGITILMVEQNATQALRLSHRGYVLDAGQNRYEGEGPQLLRDPRVAELYLGG